YDPSSLERQDDDHVEDVECHGRDREEIDGERPCEMIADECRPRLRWSARPTASFRHVASDCVLVDTEAELREFLRDPSATPARVLGCHPNDQLDDLGLDSRPAEALGLPRPKPGKPASMPPYDRLGLHDREALRPTRPDARKNNPERPI